MKSLAFLEKVNHERKAAIYVLIWNILIVSYKDLLVLEKEGNHEKGAAMAQQISANFFTFSDDSGTTQINYYPQAPGPLVQGQPAGGSRLEYQGPEGHFVYPHAGPGRENVNVQEDDNLGPQITVVLMPSLDAGSVLLTLLLPPINMAGQNEQDFDTIAIKTTRYGILPRAGARITYEAVNLHGVAKHIILPLVAQQ